MNISEFVRQETEQDVTTIRGHFDEDNFAERRSNNPGAGNAYDPDSLLTGEEAAAGLTYRDPRNWPDQETYDAFVTGKRTDIENIPKIAPRVRRDSPIGALILERRRLENLYDEFDKRFSELANGGL